MDSNVLTERVFRSTRFVTPSWTVAMAVTNRRLNAKRSSGSTELVKNTVRFDAGMADADQLLFCVPVPMDVAIIRMKSNAASVVSF